MPAQRKATAKEPTPIKEVLKKKKLPAKKAAKKAVPKKKPCQYCKRSKRGYCKNHVPKTKAKKDDKKYTEAMFEKHFFALSPKMFKQMCDEWNAENLNIKITPQVDYDHWLNYFKTLPASHIRTLVTTGQDILNAEAYSALRLWADIISNPARIGKIHQTALTGPKNKEGQGIVAMALKNDRYGVLCATRDRIAEKLEKGAGARDTAALARELTEVMTQIADYEKRQGPKKSTMLGQLLDGMPGSEVKSPSTNKSAKNGKGKRKTSYAARVTIKDVEGSNG